MMESLALDLRQAVRSLISRPSLTLPAILTIALAIGANAGNPHYLPGPGHSAPIVPDKVLLLDLWGKTRDAGAVFADITWVGFTGEVIPDEFARAFAAARDGRDAAAGIHRYLTARATERPALALGDPRPLGDLGSLLPDLSQL